MWLCSSKIYLQQQVVAKFGPGALVYQAPALTPHTPLIPFMTLISLGNDLIYLFVSFIFFIFDYPGSASLSARAFSGCAQRGLFFLATASLAVTDQL